MIELQVDQHVLKKADRLDEAVFRKLMRRIEENALDSVLEGSITLSFVSDVEIQRLNRMYRNKDSVTDVLAFSYLDDYAPGDLIGEVVISHSQAARQAVGEVHHEVVMLAVHGILHVLGYDHMEAEDAQLMFSIQDSIVDEII